jgi:hypothetical protein
LSDRPGEGYTFRYSQLAKRLLQAKGGEPLPELAQELVAAIILENDRIEYGHLADDERAAGFTTAAAVAANVSQVAVGPPAGSGVICSVEGLFVRTQANVITLRIVDLTVAGWVDAGVGMFRDSRKRSGAQGATASRIWTKTNAAAAIGNSFDAPADAAEATQIKHFFPPRDIAVLGPGFGLAMDPNNAVNTAIFGGYFWRERAQESSEAMA